mmetsp:Transcript_78277/g.201528  ORF Transcript_78277/g.201528 Transcript_78277/m.201528 type:complete len:313 (+) Transcript_78277:360-1298(+)
MLHIFQDQVLGKGAGGIVYAGEFCNSPVAIKRIRSGLDSQNSAKAAKETLMALNELRILRRIRHPNIVLFYGACLDGSIGDVMLVLEQVQGTMLDECVAQLEVWKAGPPMSQEQASILTGTCRALTYLHSRQPVIVHSDLKPGNILVEWRNRQPFPRLLDFGLSRRLTRNETIRGGSPRYIAPEVMRGGSPLTPAADVFSLGVLLFFVASGRKPWARYQDNAIVQRAREACLPPLSWVLQTALLSQLRPRIEQCIALDPTDRPSVQLVYDEIVSGGQGPPGHHQATISPLTNPASSSGSLENPANCAAIIPL